MGEGQGVTGNGVYPWICLGSQLLARAFAGCCIPAITGWEIYMRVHERAIRLRSDDLHPRIPRSIVVVPMEIESRQLLPMLVVMAPIICRGYVLASTQPLQ